MKFNTTDLAQAKELDLNDVLRKFRDEFVQTPSDEIYLNGNSLGPLPLKTKERLDKTINAEWGEQLVRGWQNGWFELSDNVSEKIAKILGADSDEVLAADSTSVNLFKLISATLKLQKGRSKIVSDEFNFPSDLYVIQGIIDQLSNGHRLELVKSRDEITIETEDIESAIDDDTALVILSHSCFKSGFLYDMKEITSIAHKKGALVLWDLSHSGGVVDINLDESNVDLAVGCTYKYMSGGPGSPAYLFVKKELQNKLTSPVWGWFGEKNPFEFSIDYRPAEGIRKFQVGTPPIISLSAVDSSLDLILEAGIDKIRHKSIIQTDYLIYLTKKILLPQGFKLLTPIDSSKRGSHIAIVREDAHAITNAIKYNRSNASVIFDFRKPSVIRLSVSPLYNTYEELWKTINAIEHLVLHNKFETTEDISGVT